jgi:hypothetical protein
MTLNASVETVQAVTEAFKLAAFLDDRIGNPDRYRLAAWSEQAERHRLTEADLLDGVQAFHDEASDHAMQCGDLMHHARHAKIRRLEMEHAARESERERIIDRKAADDVAVVMGVMQLGPVKNDTERLKVARAALQNCDGRVTAVAAIREYFAAKAEATKVAS